MNIRKNIDYSAMFTAMDAAVDAELPQMKLYCELGRLICERLEKGAAVAAAEHLHSRFPKVSGFSPRNLRRMREFYRMYAGNAELLALAMKIAWTQNVVILEAKLEIEERRWYLRAASRFGWSKAELQRKIDSNAYLEIQLDELENQCYTELNCDSYDQGTFPLSRQDCWPNAHLQNGGRDDEYTVFSEMQLFYEDGLAIKERRLRRIRSSDCDGTDRPTGHVPYLRGRLYRGNVPPGRVHRPPKGQYQSIRVAYAKRHFRSGLQM